MAVPQGPKQVGFGGCLVSILLFFVGVGAFVGLLVWAVGGVVSDLQAAPSVPIGSSGTVSITNTGQQFLFLGDLDGGGTIPSTDPDVTVTDPSGNAVSVKAPTSTSSGSSGSAQFRSIGEFTASTAGTYTIESTAAPGARGSGAKIYVTNINIGSLGAKILAAVGVGGALVLLSIILGIVWLVRRSKSKSAPAYPQAYPPQYPGQYPPQQPPPYQQR